MTLLQRIEREPAALLGFATAILTVLTATGVLDETGAAVALGVVTAALGLLRYLTVPAAEVVVQQTPDGVQHFRGGPGEHRRDDTGATLVETAAAVVLILLAVVIVLTLIR